jgi:hypothetical protein
MKTICVFCLNIWEDVVVCPDCNEYKGLMPIEDAKEYLGEDFPENEE